MLGMEWLLILNAAQNFVMILGIITAIAVFYSKYITPKVKLVKETSQKISKSLSYLVLLENISKEFKPNGGSSLRDATNRLEQTTSRIAARQTALINLNPEPIFESNTSGEYILANQAWSELTGLSTDDALHYGWINTIHPDDLDRVRAAWESAVADHRDFTQTFRIVTPKGETKKVVAHAVWAKFSSTALYSLVGTLKLIVE